jgi:SHO1 osmosensor
MYVCQFLLTANPFVTTHDIVEDGNATVRLLWFGIIIQFILLVEILEVVISGMFAYGVQISIFAGLVTVFAVLGADQNIYASSSAQKAIGAGWLITAIIDLLWIIYFTSPPDSHFLRLASKFTPSSEQSEHIHTPKTIEKVLTSQDAFVMSPPNGSNIARPDAELSKVPERTAGYDLNDVEVQPGVRIKSGGLWSNYTQSPQLGGNKRATMSSVADGAQGVEIEPNAQSTEREASVRPESVTTGVSAPDTPTQKPHSRGSQSRAPRMLPQPVVPVEPQSPEEPIAQWRAEALFDCESYWSSPSLCSVVLN